MVELPDFRSHSNFRPFATQTLFDHLKSRLARISDLHCTWFLFLMGHLNSPRPSFEWKAKKHISFSLVLFTFLMLKMWKKPYSDQRLESAAPKSGLHWLVLVFLYAIFVQWSILATNKCFLPHPSPTHILSAQSIILYAQMQCSFVTHTH